MEVWLDQDTILGTLSEKALNIIEQKLLVVRGYYK